MIKHIKQFSIIQFMENNYFEQMGNYKVKLAIGALLVGGLLTTLSNTLTDSVRSVSDSFRGNVYNVEHRIQLTGRKCLKPKSTKYGAELYNCIKYETFKAKRPTIDTIVELHHTIDKDMDMVYTDQELKTTLKEVREQPIEYLEE